jgi:hypothetical protein
MKKSAKEWFAQLPEPIRSQAVANWEEGTSVTRDQVVESVCDALIHGFIWESAPESKGDITYWAKIYTRAKAGEFDQAEPNLHGFSAKIDKDQVIKAYCHIRTIDNTIPDDLLNFIKDSAISKLDNLHGWISVSDRLPTQGEAVLVIGDFNSELSGFLEKNQCGLVAWGSVEYSQCKDYCYFPQWYTNIKFWQPLPKLPEVKGGGDGE